MIHSTGRSLMGGRRVSIHIRVGEFRSRRDAGAGDTDTHDASTYDTSTRDDCTR